MRYSIFNSGVAETTVAKTTLSEIDGDAGRLRIGGYPVDELAANASYEEACYLLVRGRLPTEAELETFRADLARRREVGKAVRTVLREAATTGEPPMAALRMGMAAATLGSNGDDPEAVARRVVAVAPTIVATYWRCRQECEPIDPRADLGHAANYLYMLTGTEPTDAAVCGLETFLTTVIDHGLTTSTFTARVVASAESDLVSAATAAIGAFAGRLHGRDRGVVFDLLAEIDDPAEADSWVRDRLAADQQVMGFGHPIYRVEDPRVAVISAAAERLAEASDAIDAEFLETVRETKAVIVDTLSTVRPAEQVQPNVDFNAGVLLSGVDIPRDLFTATFAIARVGGWMAHSLEQLEDNHLIRPVSRYVGEAERTWTPLDRRYRAGDRIVERPLESTALEPVSETLTILSEPSRLELLFVLYDLETPVTYSTFREATTIEDSGRFNYHLRQLRGTFVHTHDERYRLTDAGRTVVRRLLTEESLQGLHTDSSHTNDGT